MGVGAAPWLSSARQGRPCHLLCCCGRQVDRRGSAGAECGPFCRRRLEEKLALSTSISMRRLRAPSLFNHRSFGVDLQENPSVDDQYLFPLACAFPFRTFALLAPPMMRLPSSRSCCCRRPHDINRQAGAVYLHFKNDVRHHVQLFTQKVSLQRSVPPLFLALAYYYALPARLDPCPLPSSSAGLSLFRSALLTSTPDHSLHVPRTPARFCPLYHSGCATGSNEPVEP